jgi:ubiquinone biosynthesis protein COQ9
MSLGENIHTSVSELAKLSDEMWFLAGDDSHDMNWYSKRATLSGVYAITGELTITLANATSLHINFFAELFMTQDTSAGFEETWKFLDRRLNDVKVLGKTASNISTWLDFTAHALSNVLRSKNIRFI